MIGATLESWHSRAMRVVVEGVGGGGEFSAKERSPCSRAFGFGGLSEEYGC